MHFVYSIALLSLLLLSPAQLHDHQQKGIWWSFHYSSIRITTITTASSSSRISSTGLTLVHATVSHSSALVASEPLWHSTVDRFPMRGLLPTSPGNRLGSAVALMTTDPDVLKPPLAIVGLGQQNNHRGVRAGGAWVVTGPTAAEVTAATIAGEALPYWERTTSLYAADGRAYDEFGYAVAIRPGVFAVSSLKGDDPSRGVYNCGAVYIFSQYGSSWTQRHKILATGGLTDDKFGASVALSSSLLSGNIVLVVGAPNRKVTTRTQAGSVFVYQAYSSPLSTFTARAVITSPQTSSYAHFGAAVAITATLEEQILIVGGPQQSVPGYEVSGVAGVAWIYVPTFQNNFAGWTVAARLLGKPVEALANFGESVAISPSLAVVGAPRADAVVGAFDDSGVVFVYTPAEAGKPGGDWVLAARLVATDASEDARFGSSVAVSQDAAIVVVGADADPAGYVSGERGAAYIFVPQSEAALDGPWVQACKLVSDLDSSINALMGSSVAISGNDVLVGAPAAYGTRGGVYHTHALTVEHSVQTIAALDSARYDYFGRAVDAFKNVIAIAAPLDEADQPGDEALVSAAGSVHIYAATSQPAALQPQGWLHAAKVVPQQVQSNAQFGSSVTVGGSGTQAQFVAVGAVLADPNGEAYVFVPSVAGHAAGPWRQAATLTPPASLLPSRFGISMDSDGDTIVVGASYSSPAGITRAGAAFVYQSTAGDAWRLVTMLNDTDAQANDNLGISVAIADDWVMAGAPFDHAPITDSGSVSVFKLSGGGAGAVLTSQVAKLVPSDGTAEYQGNFGQSVAMSRTTVAGPQLPLIAAIGAHKTDPVGVATNAGVVYVFALNATTQQWSQRARLTAPGGTGSSYFGYAVALADGVLLAGAPYEDVRPGIVYTGEALVFAANTSAAQPLSSWVNTATFETDDTEYSNLGFSVALTEHAALVGVPGARHGTSFEAVNSGAVRYFVNTAAPPAQLPFASYNQSRSPLTPGGGNSFDNFGIAVALTEDGHYLAATAPYSDGAAGDTSAAGRVYVMQRSPGGTWTKVASVWAESLGALAQLGLSVALHSSPALGGLPMVAAGAPNVDDPDTGTQIIGAVVVANGSAVGPWEETVIYPMRTSPDTRCGTAVALTNVTTATSSHLALVTGCPGYALTSPTVDSAAFVHAQGSDGSWRAVAQLTHSPAASEDRFGNSISAVGSIVAVGAMGLEGGDGIKDMGGVFIYDLSTLDFASPTLQLLANHAAITKPGPAGEARFGNSVALARGLDGSGAPLHVLLVGAPRVAVSSASALSGTAYLYTNEVVAGLATAAWELTATLVANDATAGSQFGLGVALHPDGLVAYVSAERADVGAEAVESGVVYVFAPLAAGNAKSPWVQMAELWQADAAHGDRFATALSTSKLEVAMGAPGVSAADGQRDNAGEVVVMAADIPSLDQLSTESLRSSLQRHLCVRAVGYNPVGACPAIKMRPASTGRRSLSTSDLFDVTYARGGMSAQLQSNMLYLIGRQANSSSEEPRVQIATNGLATGNVALRTDGVEFVPHWLPLDGCNATAGAPPTPQQRIADCLRAAEPPGVTVQDGGLLQVLVTPSTSKDCSATSGAQASSGGAQASFNDCAFIAGRALRGGCMHVGSTASAYLTDCVMQHCVAATGGGMFAEQSSAVTLVDSQLRHNRATLQHGGGVAASSRALLTMRRVQVEVNEAAGRGGGIHAQLLARLDISGTTIGANVATHSGGGVALDSASAMVANSRISDNVATTDAGGGVSVGEGGSLLLTDSTVTGNAAQSGGALASSAGSQRLDVTGGVLENNTVAAAGGALYAAGGVVALSGTTLRLNRAGVGGGGLACQGSASVACTDCKVVNNTVGSRGGGLQVLATCSVQLQGDSTVVGNRVTSQSNTQLTDSSGGGAFVSAGLLTPSGASWTSPLVIGSSTVLNANVAARGSALLLTTAADCSSNATACAVAPANPVVQLPTSGSARVSGDVLWLNRRPATNLEAAMASPPLADAVVTSMPLTLDFANASHPLATTNPPPVVVSGAPVDTLGLILRDAYGRIVRPLSSDTVTASIELQPPGSAGLAPALSGGVLAQFQGSLSPPQAVFGALQVVAAPGSSATLVFALSPAQGVASLHIPVSVAPCEAGQQVSAADGRVCKDCAAGTYSPVPTTLTGACQPCVGGVSLPKSPKCTPCIAGSEPVDGVRCAPCTSPLGVSNGTVCVDCEPGTVPDTTSRDKCRDCPSRLIRASSSSVCVPCADPGSVPAAGRTSCEACPAGHVPHAATRSSCVPCPAGTEPQAGVCEPCVSAVAASNGTICQDCPAGTVPDPEAPAKCIFCGLGAVRDKASTRCTQCPAQHYAAPGHAQCVPCPHQGVQCTDGVLVVLPGWWAPELADSTNVESGSTGGVLVNSATQFYECAVGACEVTGNSSATKCAVGHTGTLCAVCEDNYYPHAQSCRSCGSHSLNLALVVIGIIVGIAGASFTVWRSSRLWRRVDARTSTASSSSSSSASDSTSTKQSTAAPQKPRRSRRSRVMLASSSPTNRAQVQAPRAARRDGSSKDQSLVPIIKIAYSYFQRGNYMNSFDIPWPAAVSSMWSSSGSASTLPVGAGFVTCVLDIGQYELFWVAIALPVVIAVVLGVLWATARGLRGLPCCIKRARAARIKFRWYTYTTAVTIVAYLLYSTVSRFVVRMLDCSEPIGESQTRYLEADFRIQCHGSTYRLHMIVALVVIAAFCLGFPMLTALMLSYRRRQGRLHDQATRKQLLFLYQEYRDKWCWWESVILFRKFALACAGAVLGSGTGGGAFKCYAALFVLAASLAAHLAAQPHIRVAQRRLETASLLASSVSLYLGLLFVVADNTDGVVESSTSDATQGVGSLSLAGTWVVIGLLFAVNGAFMLFLLKEVLVRLCAGQRRGAQRRSILSRFSVRGRALAPRKPNSAAVFAGNTAAAVQRVEMKPLASNGRELSDGQLPVISNPLFGRGSGSG